MRVIGKLPDVHSGLGDLYIRPGCNRHVDSAQMYKNEAHVAEAFRESGLDREQVFISQ